MRSGQSPNTLQRRFRTAMTDGGIDAEILDPKGETYIEMKLCIAAEWLAADEETRSCIPPLIYVIDWTDRKITPVDPLDTSDDAISPAYCGAAHQNHDTDLGSDLYGIAATASLHVEEILGTSLRVTRSAGVSLKLISQKLIPDLPRRVVENILLNTHIWSIFGTRPDEAELLYPNVLRDPADHRSEGERKRAFLAEMQSLPGSISISSPRAIQPCVAGHRTSFIRPSPLAGARKNSWRSSTKKSRRRR